MLLCHALKFALHSTCRNFWLRCSFSRKANYPCLANDTPFALLLRRLALGRIFNAVVSCIKFALSSTCHNFRLAVGLFLFSMKFFLQSNFCFVQRYRNEMRNELWAVIVETDASNKRYLFHNKQEHRLEMRQSLKFWKRCLLSGCPTTSRKQNVPTVLERQ